MNTYTINDISKMLHTNPETVRQWIKTGKLKGQQPKSKKEGWKVTAQMLGDFLCQNPKYAGVATNASTAAIVTGGLSLATSIVMGIIVQGKINKEALDNSQISPSDLRLLIDEEISVKKKAVTEKKAALEKLEKEINKLEKGIFELETAAKTIETDKERKEEKNGD